MATTVEKKMEKIRYSKFHPLLPNHVQFVTARRNLGRVEVSLLMTRCYVVSCAVCAMEQASMLLKRCAYFVSASMPP